jgi:hypothetical protein
MSPFLYPPGTGCPGYIPRHWVPYSSPPMTCRATVEVSEFASTRISLNSNSLAPFFYSNFTRTEQKNSSIVNCVSVASEICLPSRCLAMYVSYDFTFPAFWRHATIYLTSSLAQVVELLTYIQEVPGSSLNPDNHYLV